MTSKILNAACVLIGCGLAAQAGAAGCETNLLTNPGFEQGQTGWSLPPAKVVSGGRSGRASLYYSNPDPAEYHQMLQTLQVKAGQTIAFSQFFGQHGYLPNLVDLPHNVNMHGTFIAAGPGIRKSGPLAGVRAIDLAPTLSFLLGIPGPQNARGKILYRLLEDQGKYKELTVLQISDYHGQLVPLAETADNVTSSGARCAESSEWPTSRRCSSRTTRRRR